MTFLIIFTVITIGGMQWHTRRKNRKLDLDKYNFDLGCSWDAFENWSQTDWELELFLDNQELLKVNEKNINWIKIGSITLGILITLIAMKKAYDINDPWVAMVEYKGINPKRIKISYVRESKVAEHPGKRCKVSSYMKNEATPFSIFVNILLALPTILAVLWGFKK